MAIETVDLTGDAPRASAPPAKRRRKADLPEAADQPGSSKAVDSTHHEDAEDEQPKTKKAKKTKEPDAEKRLKRYQHA